MSVPTYTVPTANTDTSTEEPKIITALSEIKAILNGGLEDDNFASGSDLALSRLDDGTSAQLIVLDGSGVPVYKTVTGDVTISNAGVTDIAANSVGQPEIGSLPGCRVYRDTEEATSGGALTAMHFTQERFDVGPCHSTSSMTERVFAPVAGVYAISASVGIDEALAAGDFTVSLISLGGVTIAQNTCRTAIDASVFGTMDDLGDAAAVCTVSSIWKFAALDYFTVATEETMVGATNLIGEASLQWVSDG